MDTIAPPASVVNSLFRRPASKEDERRKRQEKAFKADHDDDEDVIVETEAGAGAPGSAALHAYGPSGALAAEDVPAAEDDRDMLPTPGPGDRAPYARVPLSDPCQEEEKGAEVLAAAILLAEEERLGHEDQEERKPTSPYGSATANPCGGQTDVET